jgi:two-component system chemotaxis response regulator CheB
VERVQNENGDISKMNNSQTSKKIRVLIVDDSSIIRSLLTKLLSADPEIEVVGTAPDPYVAREKLVALKPDVMTLDVEMPKMDGITFLSKVMQHFPTRTIILSSLSTHGSETALRALELGAIDVMAKPAIDVKQSMHEMGLDIVARVKAAASARFRTSLGSSAIKNLQRPAPISRGGNDALAKTTHQILAIASSTGGTEALKEILPYLPSDLPGTVIVQHMPPVFTKTYADHLQRLCPFEVKEAVDGDRVLPGRVLIAPGNFHMELGKSGAYYHVKLHQEPLLHGVRPAADYLMKSVAKYAGNNAIGLILTGMGKDGAEGLRVMREAGSFNIAQSEDTCVVYGMPKVAVDCGAIHQSVALEDIAKTLIYQFKKRAVA